MSWFSKSKSREEAPLSDDEVRELKVEKLQDTLRKLNVDHVLNDDEIARVSQLSLRVTQKDTKLEESEKTEVSKMVPQKQPNEDEAKTKPEEAPVSPMVRIIEEHYEAQFWD